MPTDVYAEATDRIIAALEAGTSAAGRAQRAADYIVGASR